MPGSFSSSAPQRLSFAGGRKGWAESSNAPSARRRPAADEDEVVGAAYAASSDADAIPPGPAEPQSASWIAEGATPVDPDDRRHAGSALDRDRDQPIRRRVDAVPARRLHPAAAGNLRIEPLDRRLSGRAGDGGREMTGIGAASARLSFGGGAATAVPGTASSRNASAAGMRMTGLLVVVTRRCPVPLTGD